MKKNDRNLLLVSMIKRIEFNWKLCKGARQSGVCQITDLGFHPCELACLEENKVNLIRRTSEGKLYTCAQCQGLLLPCVHYLRYKNVPLESFLKKPPTSRAIPAPLCGADAIGINNGVEIDHNRCVGCLLCGAYCPISAIVFDKHLQAYVCTPSSCSRPCLNACKSEAISLVKVPMSGTKFKTIQRTKAPIPCENKELLTYLKRMDFDKVRLPKKTNIIDGIPVKVNFEDFSESDEVRILTPWAANALLFIYSLPPNRGIYEVQLPQPQGQKRYPRPDFCLLSLRENVLLMLESKKNFLSAKSGVINQIAKKYREKVISIVSKHNLSQGTNLKSYIPLFIGGKDTEIKPKRTNLSFYENLINFDIPVMSASFLWVLLASKLFGVEAVSSEKFIHSVLSKHNTEGLLKNGAIVIENDIIKLRDYRKFIWGK